MAAKKHKIDAVSASSKPEKEENLEKEEVSVKEYVDTLLSTYSSYASLYDCKYISFGSISFIMATPPIVVALPKTIPMVVHGLVHLQ